jgi:hypothetical protein
VDALIDNQQVKEFLTKKCWSPAKMIMTLLPILIAITYNTNDLSVICAHGLS